MDQSEEDLGMIAALMLRMKESRSPLALRYLSAISGFAGWR